MSSNFLPGISVAAIEQVKASGDDSELYDLFTQPLHEELYRRKTFDFLDELSDGQQLFLAYDYVRMQVGQGGFIQFIENGYIGLLPSIIEQFLKVGCDGMAGVLDDVLKVYVLNREQLGKPTTVQEFAQLYDEFKEFEIIEERYNQVGDLTLKLMLQHALGHLDEFVSVRP